MGNIEIVQELFNESETIIKEIEAKKDSFKKTGDYVEAILMSFAKSLAKANVEMINQYVKCGMTKVEAIDLLLIDKRSMANAVNKNKKK